MKKLFTRSLALIFCIVMGCSVFLTGCQTDPGDPVPAVTVTLDRETVELEIDGVVQLFADVKNAPEGAVVSWKTDNEAVATVSKQGVVNGVAVGTAVITASVGDKSDTCTVTVKEKPGTVKFISNGVIYNTIDLPAGSTYRLPVETTGNVTWKADREGISLEENLLTASTAGSYVVTATAGGKDHKLTVNVYAKDNAGGYLKEYSTATNLKEADGVSYWGDTASVYSVTPKGADNRFGMDKREKQVLYRFDFVMPKDYSGNRNALSGLGENILGIYNLDEDQLGGYLAEFVKDSSISGSKDGYEGDRLRIYDARGELIETPVLATFKAGEIYTVEFNCAAAADGRYLSFAMAYNGEVYVSNVAALSYHNTEPAIIFSRNAVSTAPGTSLTVEYDVENIDDVGLIDFTSDKDDFSVTNNEDGTFTVTVAEGTEEKRATITAAYGENCQATILVNARDTAVTIDKTEASIFVGKTVTLKGTVENAGDGAEIGWASEKEAIATVEDGVVTGISVGSTKITLTCRGVTAECTVTVTQESSISLESRGVKYNAIDMPVGASYRLPFVSEGEVVWSVRDQKAGLSAEGGVLTATAAGTYTVIASADKGAAELNVTVYGTERASEYLSFTNSTGYGSISRYSEEDMNVWNTDAYVYAVNMPKPGGPASEDRGIGMTVRENMVLYRFDFSFPGNFAESMWPYGGDNIMAHLNWKWGPACIKSSSGAGGGGYENATAAGQVAFYDRNGAYLEKPVESTFNAKTSFTCEINTTDRASSEDPAIKMNIGYVGTMYVSNVVALYNIPAAI